MTELPTCDLLRGLKENLAGKSAAQIATIRREIAAHIRGLEPHLKGNEIERRFGSGGIPTDMQAADNQRARLKRHRLELAYLDKLLQSLDPILAAQAAAS